MKIIKGIKTVGKGEKGKVDKRDKSLCKLFQKWQYFELAAMFSFKY